MNILHVISTIDVGGIEKFVRELAIEQSYMNNSVKIVCLTTHKNKKYLKYKIEQFKYENIEILFLDKNNISRFKFYNKLRNIIKNIDPEVINTHNEEVSFHVINSLIGLKYRIFQVIHSRICNYPFLQKYYISRFIEKTIVISNETKKNFLSSKIKENKLNLINNGIKIDDFAFQSRICNKDVKKIVCIGRLSKEKNQIILIEAYKIIIEKLREFEKKIPVLEIIGSGDDFDILNNKINSLELNKYIFLKGEKQNIPEILRDADIYVLPSLTEGYSISLIEAKASFIPIIASDVGGNREIVKNNFDGILFENNNIIDLCEKLFDLINNFELRDNFIINSKKRIEEFDIKICALKYNNLYNKY